MGKGLYTRDDSQPLDLKGITSMLQRETSDENINYSIDAFAKDFKLVYQQLLIGLYYETS